MRVACVNLPWTVGERRGVRAGSRWPFTSTHLRDGRLLYVPFPFFLSYTVSLLKKGGFDARCFDAIAAGLDENEVIEQIVAYGPRLLVAETTTPSFSNDIRILEKLSGISPETMIVLAGPHAGVFAGQILKEYPFIFAVAIGEYEMTVVDLALALERHDKDAVVAGLAARQGPAVVYEARPPLEDLDALPWPVRDPALMDRYRDAFCGLPEPSAQMITSRGCPFGCIFCLWPQAMYRSRRYRTRSPRDVVDEMAWVAEHYACKSFYFDDDIFNVERDHVLGICAHLRKRGLGIPWAAMARADLMDEEMLRSLAQAGLYAVKYGVESADPGVLKQIKKNLDLARTRSVIAMTQRLGIKVHLTFCLGLPGETRQSVEETKGFIEEIRPDSVQFTVATPFPGTEYFRSLQQEGALSGRPWEDFDGGRKCIVSTKELSSADIERLHEDIRCRCGG